MLPPQIQYTTALYIKKACATWKVLRKCCRGCVRGGSLLLAVWEAVWSRGMRASAD